MVREYVDFPIEMHIEPELGDDLEKRLYIDAEDHLKKLAKHHTDITGAAVDITQPAQSRETPYIYEATVVVYARPKNIAATEKHGDVGTALRGALKAAERQIRDKREQLRH